MNLDTWQEMIDFLRWKGFKVEKRWSNLPDDEMVFEIIIPTEDPDIELKINGTFNRFTQERRKRENIEVQTEKKKKKWSWLP